MLTPVDIHNKEFSTSFRGFNKEDVDDFLDQVVNDYEALYRENRQLKKEIELNQKQLAQYHQLEKNLQDTLLVAQRTADEVVTTANTRGEEIRQAAKQAGENLKREAQLYADKLRQETENYASKLRQDTEQDCKRKIEHAASQIRSVVEEYDRLVRERRQFVAKMRNLMQTELGLLEEAYDIMPDKVENHPKQAETKSDLDKAHDENMHFEAQQDRDDDEALQADNNLQKESVSAPKIVVQADKGNKEN